MFKKAIKLLKKADNILILSHIRPDGDTLGSAFALCEALSQKGKRVAVGCNSKVTRKYQLITKTEDLSVKFAPDFVITVDTASPELLGEDYSIYAERTDLVIDHHGTNKGYGKCNIISPTYSSTGEIVYELLLQLKTKITPSIASNLYIAMMTDTGCFRYSNTTPSTLRAAAFLMECGAKAYSLNKYMFETTSKEGIMLRRLVYQGIRIEEQGKIATVLITEKMLKSTGATDDDIEAVTSIPRKIEGVLVGYAIKQIAEDIFKVSARSGEQVDVSDICQKFGGGGHKRASGCTINGKASDVEAQIIEVTRQYLRENNL